jgi:hypothetical protein
LENWKTLDGYRFSADALQDFVDVPDGLIGIG